MCPFRQNRLYSAVPQEGVQALPIVQSNATIVLVMQKPVDKQPATQTDRDSSTHQACLETECVFPSYILAPSAIWSHTHTTPLTHAMSLSLPRISIKAAAHTPCSRKPTSSSLVDIPLCLTLCLLTPLCRPKTEHHVPRVSVMVGRPCCPMEGPCGMQTRLSTEWG